MHPTPLYSTITLFAEILITCSILYIFYSGYKKNIFHKKLTIMTLAYEILFNISYMVSSSISRKNNHLVKDPFIGLAIFHGILSLIMFITLIIFLLLAWRGYGKGINYFKQHKNLTFVFLFFWMLSVLSGIAFYIADYYF